MESYGSMHGIVWNHMVPCMESYGNIWLHAWNRMKLYNCRHEIGLNHMENEGMDSMELHGSLMNLDPGTKSFVTELCCRIRLSKFRS